MKIRKYVILIILIVIVTIVLFLLLPSLGSKLRILESENESEYLYTEYITESQTTVTNLENVIVETEYKSDDYSNTDESDIMETNMVLETNSEIVGSESELQSESEIPLENTVGFVTSYDFSVLKDGVNAETYEKALITIRDTLPFKIEYGYISDYVEVYDDYKVFYLIAGQQFVYTLTCYDNGDVDIEMARLRENDVYIMSVEQNASDEGGINLEYDETELSTLDIENLTLFLPTRHYEAVKEFLEYGYGNCTYMTCIDRRDELNMVEFFIQTDRCIVEGYYNLSNDDLRIWNTSQSEKDVLLRVADNFSY